MNNDLRDAPEQTTFRESFRVSGKAGPTTACPCCCPNASKKRKYVGFERGMCGELVAMRCNNCGYIRTSKPRETKRHNGLTIAQEKSSSRCVAWLERWHNRCKVSVETTSEPAWDGSVTFTIRWESQAESALLRMMEEGWAMVSIGPVGGIRVRSYRSGIAKADQNITAAGLFAQSVNGKLDLI